MALSGLAGQLKKRNAFGRPEDEAYLNLIRTAQWLAHDTEKFLKKFGLSEATYNVLRILRGEGGEGLPSLEIASRMVTRVPDITRLIDRLVKQKLVERNRTDRDRRIVLVAITRKGADLLAKMDKPTDAQLSRLLSHMSADELNKLSQLLEKARQSVEGPCQEKLET